MRPPRTRSSTARESIEGSLTRLGTDYIDLYYAHQPDPETPLEESLGTFDELVREGKVRQIGISNAGPSRIREELAFSRGHGLAAYVALQTRYNLVERSEYESDLADVCVENDLSCLPYFGLAGGFLTGKYRPGNGEVDSPRAGHASKYLDARGLAVLETLDEIGATHGSSAASVALAWLSAQPTVTAPIASARTPEQLVDLLPVSRLRLSEAELGRLDSASRVAVGAHA